MHALHNTEFGSECASSVVCAAEGGSKGAQFVVGGVQCGFALKCCEFPGQLVLPDLVLGSVDDDVSF